MCQMCCRVLPRTLKGFLREMCQTVLLFFCFFLMSGGEKKQVVWTPQLLGQQSDMGTSQESLLAGMVPCVQPCMLYKIGTQNRAA